MNRILIHITVDARYFIRAEEELDPTHWILVKSGEAGSPSIESWLISILNKNSTVGQNAKLTSICKFEIKFKIFRNLFKNTFSS
jgi:hypothetical protein